ILVWYPGNPIPIRYLYLDGIQEWEPEIYKDFIAYDYYDPTKNNWDVAVHDIRTNTNVTLVPDKGSELNADIWDNFVAFEVDQKQIVRYNLSTGAYEPAKVPGGCSGFIEPKLAGKYFVIFAATGCKSKDQLWLYDYIDKKLWSSSTTSVRTAIPATTPPRIGSYTSTNRSCPYTSSSICSDSRSP